MSESVIPYYIPPSGGPGTTSVVQIKDPAINTQKNLLELVVLSGGPVFGWTGRRDGNSAYADTHPANTDNVEFDFAGSIQHPCEFVVGELGTMSLASDNESIGYIRVIEIA